MDLMTFTIHTYGGGEILERALNGIARVFYSDNQYLTLVGKIFAVLGALYAAIKATVSGDVGKFVYHWLFPSVLVFLLAFSLKTKVHIQDHVNLRKQNIVIDNIPLAVSFFSSLSSTIAHFLTEELEENLMPANYSKSYGRHQGILFGAKILAKTKDFKNHDPHLWFQMKEFCKQCVIKPFLILDAGGLGTPLRSTPTMLDRLSQYPASNFWGVFMREDPTNPLSPTKYYQCKDAIQKIKNEHIPSRPKRAEFASVLGMNNVSCAQFEDIGQYSIKTFLKEHFWFHDWLMNAMMHNAIREAGDDMREEVGLSRRYVSAQATRGLFQQAFGSILSGEMVSTTLPMLQYAILATIICALFVILPLAVLPGGWAIFKSWVFAIIWVNSWQVFYTIINALGIYRISSSLEPFREVGYNYTTIDDISEILLYNYGIFQMLAAAVPIISFGLLKGSEYAMTQVASSFLSSGTGASIGAQAVDGNMQMGNVSVGQKVDTGTNILSKDALTGRETIKIGASGMEGFSITSSEAQTLANTAEKIQSEQNVETTKQSLANSESQLLQDTINFGQNFSTATRLSDEASLSRREDYSKAMQDANSRGLNIGGSLGINAGGDQGGLINRIKGAMGAFAGVAYRDDFTDTELASWIVAQSATNSVVDSAGQENTAAKNLATSYNQVQTYTEAHEAAQSKLKSYAQREGHTTQTGTNITQDLMAKYLDQIVNKQGGLETIMESNEDLLQGAKASLIVPTAPTNDIAQTKIENPINKETSMAEPNQAFTAKGEEIADQTSEARAKIEQEGREIKDNKARIEEENQNTIKQGIKAVKKRSK